MDSIQLDPVSIGVAALLFVLIHAVWYSKWMFGPKWHELTGVKEKDSRKNRVISVVSAFIRGLVIAYFLSFFDSYLNVTSVADGVFVAFCVWLGFVATAQVSGVFHEQKPARLFFLQTGCSLIAYLVMGGVIGS